MIDIANEQLLTLKEAAKRLPLSRGGRPRSPATIWRWIMSRKLEGTRFGEQWVTSVEALQRYAERQTIAALGDVPVPPVSLQTMSRKRAIERAEEDAKLIFG